MNKAVFVAVGIFLSRLTGLIRLRTFAHYFGQQSEAADAFNAAFRIPNFLQNLFGEGALSASFIPVYSGLMARGEKREADHVAGAVAAILGLLVSVLVLMGIFGASLLTTAIAPGFTGAKRELTVQLVRVLFPGAGLLVLSAWCLGILNSHQRFLLSYAAPVMWNAVMIATLIIYGHHELPRLAAFLAWGSVAGSALQFGIQLPAVLRLATNLRFAIDSASQHVRTVIRNFVPAFGSRGVIQISAYIDELIASLLPTGAMTGLSNAQLLYTLPVSLFGMSVSAAELPAMSAALGTDSTAFESVRTRLNAGLRRIAFFVVPSAVAFLTLGDVIAAAVLQTGRFQYADAVYVWAILAGYSVALLPATFGRLYSSTYYAMRDTRTPLRYALVHVAVASVLGYVLAIPLPRRLGIPEIWGTAGLTLAAGIGGWIELIMLRRRLNRRIGHTGLSANVAVKLWLAAGVAAAVAWTVRSVIPSAHPIVIALLVLGPYGISFLAAAMLFRIPEASTVLRFRHR